MMSGYGKIRYLRFYFPISIYYFIRSKQVKYWLVVLASIAFLSGCEQSVQQIHLSGATMGTTYNVKYVSPENVLEPQILQKEIDRLLEQVNDQMSTYRKDSELSRFNQSRQLTPLATSPEMMKVVTEAVRLNKVTLGALDVTVGPLVNLWGFGPEGRPDVVPSDADLAERRSIIGIEHLILGKKTLAKDIPELYVDLSPIAKGWGVDVVAKYLRSQDITNYMVEIGGEIQAHGRNQEGVAWRIAIEKPTPDERSIEEIIELNDMGIATSGDYRNYFEENGIRYSHIIDPKTGRPINNKVVSVTVLDRSTMTADGLATGLMVLGDVEGIKVAEAHHIPVFMIVKTDDGFKEVVSSDFKPYLNR
jgi:thiamine biosynthesis lipoprotein